MCISCCSARQGNRGQPRIEVHDAGHKKAATDAYAVLEEAFLVAQERLKDWRRISHGDVKHKTAVKLPNGAVGPSENAAASDS